MKEESSFCRASMTHGFDTRVSPICLIEAVSNQGISRRTGKTDRNRTTAGDGGSDLVQLELGQSAIERRPGNTKQLGGRFAITLRVLKGRENAFALIVR